MGDVTAKIVVNGCLPYFTDVAAMPRGTMYFWPKKLLASVTAMPGVNHTLVAKAAAGDVELYDR